ncbi:hypothetical protein CAOG_009640 [Capsaspora owczarzaki ATCC 30864]|uniref:Uncharacterized protein n=1 Tax=Capsaspora owczarzaki (strain ATCC 30864) TaxID=595528 RepID=A0A0D2WMR2_CAPO3|nr:hypothetical protein CAOG_009640 [Capsaspora owczarzaki ATCC 30864]
MSCSCLWRRASRLCPVAPSIPDLPGTTVPMGLYAIVPPVVRYAPKRHYQFQMHSINVRGAGQLNAGSPTINGISAHVRPARAQAPRRQTSAAKRAFQVHN